MTDRPYLVGVIGASRATAEGEVHAYEVGRLIAEAGGALVCGGLGGVMAASAKGCTEAGGLVIGILPGDAATDANPHVTIPIVTDMGHARNVVIAQTANVLISIEGEYGTLSEVAISLKLGKKVFTLDSWVDLPGGNKVSSPAEAVAMAFNELGVTQDGDS